MSDNTGLPRVAADTFAQMLDLTGIAPGQVIDRGATTTHGDLRVSVHLTVWRDGEYPQIETMLAAGSTGVSKAAAALSTLLATHPELGALPIGWRIELDDKICPFITVANDRGEESLRALAAALELDVRESSYASEEHGPMQSLTAEGRWGGATWDCVAYVKAASGAGVGQ